MNTNAQIDGKETDFRNVMDGHQQTTTSSSSSGSTHPPTHVNADVSVNRSSSSPTNTHTQNYANTNQTLAQSSNLVGTSTSPPPPQQPQPPSSTSPTSSSSTSPPPSRPPQNILPGIRDDGTHILRPNTNSNPAALSSFTVDPPAIINNNNNNTTSTSLEAMNSLSSGTSPDPPSPSYSSVPSYYVKPPSQPMIFSTSTSSESSSSSSAASSGLASRDDVRCSSGSGSAQQVMPLPPRPGDNKESSCGNASVKSQHLSDQTSSRHKSELVPSSPPSNRHTVTPVEQVAQPLPPNRLSRIRQNHLALKRRGQMKHRSNLLPEVDENSELEEQPSSEQQQHHQLSPPRCVDTTSPATASTSSNSNNNSSSSSMTLPQVVTSDDDGTGQVTPSLPDSFLQKLRVSSSSASLEQMSEKEIETKFVSLSLAFQTDKLTIDQRVSVQERARDLSEQNVDKELQGLGDAVEVLNQTITDCEVREIVQRIRRHINVLEQSAARVSSRAEVYGAVQQERRMCKAIEVMVQYTENLRRTRDKEESELQEARKILNERSLGSGLSGEYDSNSNRRSMSVCGFNVMGRPMRRRSEVVLPKVLGGVGSPSLTQTASMDPRSRFQSAVASTTMKNAITNTIKRASLERLHSNTTSTTTSTGSASSTPRSSTASQPTSLLLSTASCPASVDCGKDAKGRPRPDRISESSTESKEGKSTSGDEDAYRKGFEEGVKARLSQDLVQLRDQQASISSSLEDVMDRVEQAQEHDLALIDRPSMFRSVCQFIRRLCVFVMEYDYWSNKKLIRNFAGVLFVLMAVIAVFLSPPTSTIDYQHFSKPPQ